MKKRMTALFAIVALIVTLFPVTTAKSREAQGADAIVDTNLTIALGADGGEMYKVYVEGNYLKVKAQYYHDSTATLSYHTEWLYFTADDTNGNPIGAKPYFAFDVPTNRPSVPSEDENITYEIFSVPIVSVREWAESLTGLSANGNELTIYMSQGFVLKSRTSGSSQNWTYGTEVYNTVEKIQEAAGWSDYTYFNFPAYFDVPLVLDLTTYNLTVKSDDTKAGCVAGSRMSVETGTAVYPKAVANDGFYFSHWEVTEGWVEADMDLTEASLSFDMPQTNLTLVAHFGIVLPPTDSPDPPTPTPAPVKENIVKQEIRYYTTDAGHTMAKVYRDNGSLANLSGVKDGGNFTSNEYTGWDNSYAVGTNGGNEWYFIPSGSNATYVHPKKYKGIDVNTGDIGTLTELTFPSTLSYGGSAYIVTSIGGGASEYKKSGYLPSYGGPPYTNATYGPTDGFYSYSDNYHDATDDLVYSEHKSEEISYAYGVAGTGFIRSTGFWEYYWYYPLAEKEEWDSEDYENSYYVYNTTLKSVTIPSTVTIIQDYAFFGCQALEEVNGGEGVTSIGVCAFMAADHLQPKLSERGSNLNVGNREFSGYRYYYYNESYAFASLTMVMQTWKATMSLSAELITATFPRLTTIDKQAFMWHTNLYNVELSSTLTSIGANAYAGCKLDSISIPGKFVTIKDGKSFGDQDGNYYSYGHASTLGTKGTKDTVIITVPESTAMYYGLEHDAYYMLRCGYTVTYVNNCEPEESYVSISMLKELYATAKQTVETSSFDILLDEEGNLYVYRPEDCIVASRIAVGTKFTEVRTMWGLHDTGSESEPCRWYFAMGTNGEIWGCTQYASNGWVNLAMPEGAHSFRFSGNGTDVWLYYLNAEGKICCAIITEDDSSSGGFGMRLKVVEQQEIRHDTEYKFDYILIENEGEQYPGALLSSLSYGGNTYYNGVPPQIVAHVAAESPVDAKKLIRFAAEPFGYPLGSADTVAARYTREPVIMAVGVGQSAWIHKTNKEALGDGELFGTKTGYRVSYLSVGGMLNTMEYDSFQYKRVINNYGNNQKLLYADNEFSVLGYEMIYDGVLQFAVLTLYHHASSELGSILADKKVKAVTYDATIGFLVEEDTGAFYVIKVVDDNGSFVAEKEFVPIEKEDEYQFRMGYEFAETVSESGFEREGYEFLGWNTKADGSGRAYHPGEEICLKEPLKLYAQWNREEQETKTEEQLKIDIGGTHSRVSFGSAEYQPEEGIPSTETVSLYGSCDPFLVSCVLEQECGTRMVRAYVTVPYRTQYENTETQETVISELHTATVKVLIPKEWSYWKIKEGGVYFPVSVSVENDGLAAGTAEAYVACGEENEERSNAYCLTTYEEEERFLWETYDTDGVPMVTIAVMQEQRIVSDLPGELPDVQSYLQKLCRKEAEKDRTKLTVRSDAVLIAGVTVLSDVPQNDGNGAAPQEEAIERVREKLQKSDGVSMEQEGIALLSTAENGMHKTKAEIVYRADEIFIGTVTEKHVTVEEASDLFLHTPVLCVMELTANHEMEYQCAKVPEGKEVLVLEETGRCSDFVLKIGNFGNHNEKQGYGERSYTEYLARKEGKPQNEVRFPIEVWMDVGNDKKADNDILLKPDIWYCIGTEPQCFYLPFWTPEGTYTIDARAVAVNGADKESETEVCRNQSAEHYVAIGAADCYVTGSMYGFTVYDISGNATWEMVQEENLYYTVGLTHEDEEGNFEYFETLPLRAGCHPLYRNLGRLPLGGSFSFRLKSVGSFYEAGAVLTVIPEVMRLTENSYERVEAFFEKETEQGVFLTKWSVQERKLTFEAKEASVADERYEGIREELRDWYGTVSLPKVLYVAKEGTDVEQYMKQYGIDFTEDFWLKDEVLMLCFSIRLENAAGETLYYGKIPQEIPNVTWCLEAGTEVYIDSSGNCYPIQGGETAVLSPKGNDCNEYVIHGIY